MSETNIKYDINPRQEHGRNIEILSSIGQAKENS